MSCNDPITSASFKYWSLPRQQLTVYLRKNVKQVYADAYITWLVAWLCIKTCFFFFVNRKWTLNRKHCFV
jgi:hypothetical protein